jgi:hypothetical protein
MPLAPMIIQLILTRETLVSSAIAAEDVAGKSLDIQTVVLAVAKELNLSFERASTAWFFALPIPSLVGEMGFEVFLTDVLFPEGRVQTRNPGVKPYATAQKATVCFHPRRLRSSITTG